MGRGQCAQCRTLSETEEELSHNGQMHCGKKGLLLMKPRASLLIFQLGSITLLWATHCSFLLDGF